MGEPWPATAEEKELNNPRLNKPWSQIKGSELPSGRRVHKLVWVYKLKRDGTAKARLCVQGCTMEAGVDYRSDVFSDFTPQLSPWSVRSGRASRLLSAEY